MACLEAKSNFFAVVSKQELSRMQFSHVNQAGTLSKKIR
ncbi:hypothetical protein EV14_1977 [Prochlorococcus sp. MIT 0703]|nr:hypothetical protein EV12_0836 [Prochlorococcus sp. MIT 0701]KGG32835.1 hypothetical protein EV14_1977 [Prochlorococcus sp. MIT 0703]